MYTVRSKEVTVVWLNSKPASCKMHAFLQNAISFALLYPSLIHTKIQPYIFPILGLRFFFFFFFFFFGGGGGGGGLLFFFCFFFFARYRI